MLTLVFLLTFEKEVLLCFLKVKFKMKGEVEVWPRLNTQEWDKHPGIIDGMS